jgi:stearoyl-CoA desaturase (delta-9 desaturase)
MAASSSSVQVVNTDAKSRLTPAPEASSTVYVPQQNLPESTTSANFASREEQLHIIDQPWTLSNWHKHLNWLHVVILIGVPLLGLYGLSTTEIRSKTLVWAVIYYFMTGLGITAGVFSSSDIELTL